MSPKLPLGDYRPYVVAWDQLSRELCYTPLGQPIAEPHRFDPTRRSSAPFLRLLERLDALTYGPAGLASPRWALYDCGALPGALLGLGRSRAGLTDDICRTLGVPEDYSGLVPLSLYAALPMLERHHWLGFALCSLYEVSSESCPPALPLWTLALGLEILRAHRVTGTTQWASPKLSTYALFGPLKLLAAWLPAHTDPATCVFRFDYARQRLDRALAPEYPGRPDRGQLVDVGHPKGLCELQRQLESGRELSIAGVLDREAHESFALIHEGVLP
jgi:hypothetical protein